MKTRLAIVALFLFAAVPVSAQTAAQNPSTYCFTPPSDLTLVTSYSIEVSTGATVATTVSIGKPTPNAAGDVCVAAFQSGLAKNVTYVFNVITVGPGGSTRSALPSNPFVFPAAPGAASNLRAQ